MTIARSGPECGIRSRFAATSCPRGSNEVGNQSGVMVLKQHQFRMPLNADEPLIPLTCFDRFDDPIFGSPADGQGISREFNRLTVKTANARQMLSPQD